MQHQIFITRAELPAFEKAYLDFMGEGGWTGKRPEVNRAHETPIGTTLIVESNVQDLCSLMFRAGMAYAESIES